MCVCMGGGVCMGGCDWEADPWSSPRVGVYEGRGGGVPGSV